MRALVLSSHYRDPAARSKLRALVGLGAELYVGVPAGKAGTDGGLQVVPIPARHLDEAPERWRWHQATLKKILSEVRPDLVVVEEDAASALAATVAGLTRRAGIPLVLFSWQSVGTELGWLARRRARRTLGTAAAVIGGNERAAQLLKALAPGALVTAMPQSGIPTFPALPESDRKHLVVGFVGRLSAERRAEFLIHALGQTFGPWQLVIVGTGPEQEAIEAAIAKLGLASRVRWSGGIRREALDQTWREIDCLVMPWEDTPTWVEPHSPVLLEAMAHGIAPIVTKSGALPELVGDAGIVVTGVEGLTDALQRWVADPARCRNLGVKSRQRVLERYTDGALAARTLAFWQEVLARGTDRQAA